MYRPFYGKTKLAILELIYQAEHGLISIETLTEEISKTLRAGESQVAEPLKSSSDHMDSLGALLPWSSRSVYKGIEFGVPFSTTKRNETLSLPSTRVLALERHISLNGRVVADVGCYEGIDSVSLVDRGARVIGLDFQIENVVKAVVFAWHCGVSELAKFAICDVDKRQLIPTLSGLGAREVDLVYASGLLYHLSSPEKFLAECAETTSDLYVSTQLSAPETAIEVSEVKGVKLQGKRVNEPSTGPFRGANDHGVWFTRESLFDAVAEVGLKHIQIISETVERNGPRIDVLFSRKKGRTPKPIRLETRRFLMPDVEPADVSDYARSVFNLGGSPTRKLLVIGPAKSGTSLLVKILEQFGYWNPGADSIVGEVKIEDTRDLETYMYSIFAFLDRSESPCVVKSPKLLDPSIVDKLVSRLLNSPSVTPVLLFRNPLNIARRRAFESPDGENSLLENLQRMEAVFMGLDKLVKLEVPRVLVSGDDLLSATDSVVQQIARILEIPAIQGAERLARNAIAWKDQYLAKHDNLKLDPE